MTAHRFAPYSCALVLAFVSALSMPGCGGGSSSKNTGGGTGGPTAGIPPAGGGRTTGGSGAKGSTNGKGTTNGRHTGAGAGRTNGGTRGGTTGGSTSGGTTGGSSSGTFVYVSNATTADITGFSADQNGKLSPIPGSPFDNGERTTGLALAGPNTLIVGTSPFHSSSELSA